MPGKFGWQEKGVRKDAFLHDAASSIHFGEVTILLHHLDLRSKHEVPLVMCTISPNG